MTQNFARVLFCTVGGNTEPISNAINAHHSGGQLQKVVFVCSEPNPETGESGSDIQVPEILAAVNSADEFKKENLIVPTDDLRRIVELISGAIQAEINDCGRESISVNYAGGTKSMSAGVVLAAVDLNVNTGLSLGSRRGFDRVKPGNSYQVSVNIQDVRVVTRARSIRSLWREHAYSEAAEQFRMLPRSELSTNIMASINRQQALSTAFGTWDVFLHQDAHAELSRYTKLFGKWLGPWLNTLDHLTNNNKPERQELFLIHDLWLNAERVALRRRFDDAVGRMYRFLEWVAQIRLCQRHSIDTSDVTLEVIPEALRGRLQPSPSTGKIQPGLLFSWELLSMLETDGAISGFWTNQHRKLESLLATRNYSIMAHGSIPISEKDWSQFHGWMEDHVLPLHHEQMKANNIKVLPKQLPNSMPEEAFLNN